MKEYFYTITEGMIDLGLKGTELNLFANIFGYSKKGDGCCYATRRELARRCGVSSTNTIDSAIDGLIAKGLIRKVKLCKDDREIVGYQYAPKTAQGTQKLSTPYAKIEQGGYAKIAHMENKDIKESINIPPTPQEVVDYCREQGFRDPIGFADYYLRCQTENQWRKKSGEPIVNWKLNIQQWRRYHKDDTFPHPNSEQFTATIDQINAYLR